MSGSELSGPEFVESMEKYRIKPKDLEISRVYKMILKRGDRKPSKELVEKLIEKINSLAAGPRLGGAAGPRGPHCPSNAASLTSGI